VEYIDLGLSDYQEAYRVQCEIRDRVAKGEIKDTLIITEHKSVITIGRAGSEKNVFKTEGIRVFRVDRGGDVTYHGPGQLMAYPVFKLENEARDIHCFLRYLEDVGVNFLDKYGIMAETRPGMRGVWVRDSKIASIGIGVKKWVTYHGMAININTDLRPFSFIKPCGIEGVKITSLENILKERVDFEDAKCRLRKSFEEVSSLVETVSKVR